MKSYTDIEQSKKLAEILPIESADYFHAPDAGVVVTEPYKLNLGDETVITAYKGAIPCWSLAALLELMPIINEYNIEYRPIIERYKDDGWVCKYYNEETRNTNDVYIRRYGRTPLDAAFDMVVWLKENSKI